METQNNIETNESCRKEDVILKHYFRRRNFNVLADETESALACMHAARTEKEQRQQASTQTAHHVTASRRRNRSWVRGFCYGIAAMLAIALLIGLFWQSNQSPVVIWKAVKDQNNGVTLQCAGGDFILVDGVTDSADVAKMGVVLNDESELVYQDDDNVVATQILTTPSHRCFSVTLSDGTRVTLNANSQLCFPSRFTEEKRIVNLTGEAYFEVARDEQHPFEVHTPHSTTHVLGTQFNVRSYTPSDAHVTLIQGEVNVCSKGGAEAVLRPGQDAKIGEDGGMTVKDVDIDMYCSWKDGYFYFDEMKLDEVAREVGRWYNIDVVFSTRRNLDKSVLFSASRERDVTEVIHLLNSLGKARFSLKDGVMMVE